LREVRYRVEGEPVRASVCNCPACQCRTGSLVGFGAYFKDEQVRILRTKADGPLVARAPDAVEAVEKATLPAAK